MLSVTKAEDGLRMRPSCALEDCGSMYHLEVRAFCFLSERSLKTGDVPGS